MQGSTRDADEREVTALPGDREDGFSLVELLIVIVLLSVLAAIAVPTFLGQRDKARRGAMVSDLRSLVAAQAARSADADPMYTSSIDALRDEGYTSSQGVSTAMVFLFDNGSPQFVACVKHDALEEWLVYTSVSAVTTFSPDPCSQPL